MGCDIHGWIETKPWPKTSPDYWESVVKIRPAIVGRNYDMFGLLFGVRNYVSQAPIAEGRGLPKYDKHQTKDKDSDDRPQTLIDREQWNGDGHSDTWISYSEIAKIDWEKESEEEDERIHEYRINEEGKEEYVGKASMYGFLSQDELQSLSKNKVIDKTNNGVKFRFKIEKTKLKDSLSGDWKVLFDIMKRLAEQQENNDNVRLVVWFDN